MTDRAIPATQQPHASVQDQLSDFKINFYRRGGSRLNPWTGFAVMCGYAAILIGSAAWRIRRVDA